MNNTDFEAFKKKLEEQLTFPSVYMFKFIVLANNQKIALIESLFSEEADIHQKESSQGKYMSITAKVVMMSADEIIEIYKKALAVEGVIAL